VTCSCGKKTTSSGLAGAGIADTGTASSGVMVGAT
jgi:hypothetical protein